MKRSIYILLGVALSLTGCKYIRAHQAEGVAAEVAGQKLYEKEVMNIIGNRTGEDSARIRRDYIHQWVIENLIQNKANEYASPEIERLVADYRRSLCTYEYEKDLVRQRMSTRIADSVLTAFYEQHDDQLKLQDDIFKGVLVVIPVDAPEQDVLLNSLKQLDEEDLQFLEQYAYQNANGYELFLDEWKTATQLLVRLPIEHKELISKMKKEQQLVLQDTINKYILQLTDKCLSGNKKPFDYATPQIRKIILNERQNTFLQSEHERLYEEGLRSQKVKIYE